jgi:hypothetical protein
MHIDRGEWDEGDAIALQHVVFISHIQTLKIMYPHIYP